MTVTGAGGLYVAVQDPHIYPVGLVHVKGKGISHVQYSVFHTIVISLTVVIGVEGATH